MCEATQPRQLSSSSLVPRHPKNGRNDPPRCKFKGLAKEQDEPGRGKAQQGLVTLKDQRVDIHGPRRITLDRHAKRAKGQCGGGGGHPSTGLAAGRHARKDRAIQNATDDFRIDCCGWWVRTATNKCSAKGAGPWIVIWVALDPLSNFASGFTPSRVSSSPGVCSGAACELDTHR
jgi:hypothetical protein